MSMANLSIILTITPQLDKSTCQMSSHQLKTRLKDQILENIGLHNGNFII
jgi:hypothetical protein